MNNCNTISFPEICFNDEQKKIYMHTHNYWELTYVYSGNSAYHYKNKSRSLPIGNFILVAPETSHSIISIDKNVAKTCCIKLSSQYLLNIFARYNETDLYILLRRNSTVLLHLQDNGIYAVYKLLWVIAHECNHPTVESQDIIDSSLLSMLLVISRLYSNQLSSKASPDNISDNKMDSLIKFIISHFNQELSLKQLADYIHLSPEYLSRYFKKCMGMNLSDYINAIRIERASHMLSTTTYSVTDIGIFCGYKSIRSFQIAFKKHIGVSPSEYRKKHMNQFTSITMNGDIV